MYVSQDEPRFWVNGRKWQQTNPSGRIPKGIYITDKVALGSSSADAMAAA
jgi:hypothetical protein